MDLSEDIWIFLKVLDLFEFILIPLNFFGPFGTFLDFMELLWTFLNLLRPFLNPFGHLLTLWIFWDLYESIWRHLDFSTTLNQFDFFFLHFWTSKKVSQFKIQFKDQCSFCIRLKFCLILIEFWIKLKFWIWIKQK